MVPTSSSSMLLYTGEKMSGQSVVIILIALSQVRANELNQFLQFDSAQLLNFDFPNCKSDLERLLKGLNDSEIWAYQSK